MHETPAASSGLTLGIRIYRPADRDCCAQIYVAARKVAFPWVPADSFALDDFIRDTVDEEIHVAEGRVDGGGIRLFGFTSSYVSGRFIHHLYVDPQCRRLGIGRALARFAVATHSGPWRLKCVIANEAAMAFYRAEGWVEEGQGDDAMGPNMIFRHD